MITTEKNKPLIGITPQIGRLKGFEFDEGVVRLFPQYLKAVMAAGGLPFILPFAKKPCDIKALVDTMDGILFSGGTDVGETLYREDGDPHTYTIRDDFEVRLYKEVLRQNKPILGICRGAQLINVLRGGTLIGELSHREGITLNHEQKDHIKTPYHHPVTLAAGGQLQGICHRDVMDTNSFHHQGIGVLGADLAVEATTEDGLIEAISLTDTAFGLAVQWHPELLYEGDEPAQAIFKAFIAAASHA